MHPAGVSSFPPVAKVDSGAQSSLYSGCVERLNLFLLHLQIPGGDDDHGLTFPDPQPWVFNGAMTGFLVGGGDGLDDPITGPLLHFFLKGACVHTQSTLAVLRGDFPRRIATYLRSLAFIEGVFFFDSSWFCIRISI